MLVRDYCSAFLGRRPIIESGGSLRGRILRGKTAADFESLSDDPQRRLVMILGLDGLRQLIGMSGYEMLQFIGYTEQSIRYRIEAKQSFKLVVFSNSSISRLATWHNVLEMVSDVYPEIREYVAQFWGELHYLPFAEIERRAGYQFWEVEQRKEEDPRFMTYERLLQQERSLVALRAFLYHCVHLRELYRGDGFTDHNGRIGPAEYITPSMQLSEVGPYELLDLQVELP